MATAGEGLLVVTAVATDAAGNSTTATRDLTVDTVAPAAPTITSIPENGGGGINASEASDGTPVVVGLTGTGAVAGDRLTINWGGQTVDYTLVAGDISGNSATVTVPLATITAQGQGTFNVTATLTDAAGNASSNSTATSVTVDSLGGGSGDVHMITFDGLHYDFQAVGDFVAAQSTDPGNAWQVQIRTGSWPGAVSITTELGALVGDDRVTFAIGRESLVDIDGVPDIVLHPGVAQTIGGGTLTEVSDDAFRLDLYGGKSITVIDRGTYLDWTVALGPHDGPGSVRGLLGSNTGQTNDDFQLPDGTVLSQPLSEAEILSTFADAWTVASGTSLLDETSNDSFTLHGVTFATNPGQSFSGTVATFTDTDTVNVASDFSATINWGDGSSPTAGVISDLAGAITVTGSHTYAATGQDTVTVTLSDDAPGTATATATSTANVGQQLAGQLSLSAATEGVVLIDQTVATFTDTNASDTAAAFTAMIDWGDGTTNAGTLSGSNGSFSVAGSHTYADEGREPLSVTITGTANSASLSLSGTVAMAEGDSFTPHGVTFATNPGQSFSGTVATVTDTDTLNVASDFTATINWGDGSRPTTGVIGDVAGAITVTGTHIYAATGQDTVMVTLSDDAPGTATATATSTANVGPAATDSGLNLNSSYTGSGKPVNSLTVTATDTTPAGITTTTAPQNIEVTDPPPVSLAPQVANATISDGASLELPSGSSSNVQFAGKTGTLPLDNSQHFGGQISGFGDQDVLDLIDMPFSANMTLGYAANVDKSGGSLNINDGAHFAQLAVLGNYMATSFVTSSNGHGGALIEPSQTFSDSQSTLTRPHA